MITEDKVEAALAYLRTSVDEAAKAKADIVITEAFVKAEKARVIAESLSGGITKAEALSAGDERVTQAVAGHAEAVRLYTMHQMKREAAVMLCECWRSQEASNRAMDRAHR